MKPVGVRNDGLAIRKKQIAKLQTYFSGTMKEIVPDSVYEISVSAPGRVALRVTVTLPEQFPYQAPVLQCVPPVTSAHVDASGYCLSSAHDSLLRWSVQSDLGKVVYEVIVGVIVPAAPLSTASTSSYPSPSNVHTTTVPSRNTSNVVMSPGTFATGPAPVASPDVLSVAADVPVLPPSFPELERKSLDEVQLIVQDPTELYLFMEDVQYYKNLVRLRDSARDQCSTLAEKNLARKPELDQLRSALQKETQELELLKRSHDEKIAKQREIMQQQQVTMSPQALIGLLQDATNKLDDETERIAQNFLNGQMGMKEFLASYLEKRTLYHKRAACIETIGSKI